MTIPIERRVTDLELDVLQLQHTGRAHEQQLAELKGATQHLTDAVGDLSQDLRAAKLDITEIRHDVGEIKQVQQEHGEMLASHGEMLRSHGEMLRQILDRLPGQGS